MSGSDLRSALVVALLLAIATAAPSPAPASEISAAHDYFGDTELVTHEGERVRFYSDLLDGKVVVINAFFASCEGVCPVMAAKLAEIQSWLGDRLGEEARILSISVDPERDTPAVLADYARRWQARDGWYFLTGEPENVRRVLGRLGAAVEEREAHTNLLFVGNVPTGLWKKALGVAPAGELAAIVDSVLRDEG